MQGTRSLPPDSGLLPLCFQVSAQRLRAQRCRAQKQLRFSIITSGGLIMVNVNEGEGDGQEATHTFSWLFTPPGWGQIPERSDIKKGLTCDPHLGPPSPLLPWEAVSLPNVEELAYNSHLSFFSCFSCTLHLAQHTPPDNSLKPLYDCLSGLPWMGCESVA